MRAKPRPAPYPTHLVPRTSLRRPHCLARERLFRWKPASARQAVDAAGQAINLSDSDLKNILSVMSRAWAKGTLETYALGLLAWHVFCDSKFISEEKCAPASPVLVAAFLASMAGLFSNKTLHNYVYGVRAWHTLHGLMWAMNEDEIKTMLMAAEKLTPASSKRKKRNPFTPDFMTTIRQHLALDSPLDAAVFACLTTCFYAAARLGEFTVRRLDAFDPALHITPANLSDSRSREGDVVTVLHIPVTKTSTQGEDVYWAMQHGPTDPVAALEHHMHLNNPPPNGHLFAYKHAKGYRPLTKTKFLERIGLATRTAGLEPLQGHAIRIGATLEYLLRGVPFEVMKAKGRWSSDAFLIYLTRHAQVLAPYMQATPRLHDTFTRLIVLPVR